ncbi:MAG: Tat pathway signal sequence domain protein [Pseudomonadota bacterium]
MMRFLLAGAGALALLTVGSIARADDGRLGIELNRLDAQEGACQAYLVMQNGTETAFSALVLDLVMFDPEGIIARRLAVDVAPLRAGRTSIKVFAVDGLACDRIGRILLNDVLSCAGGGGEALPDCYDRIDPSTRTDTEFLN